ncbi:MAG: RNA polymerase sigma-70 factor, ECF subfamily [Candidatus Wolfebacteria bacterium GW2011_GWE1_48_7]|uniref:RNA polymerase sigma-70 factor, ECF subfamily n=2 Tax=Candidatus Wolfeibacteriota TaxID=1752735 RepID=A0A0G1U890_9BACT|nr:MAG: ECF subfamily RNA polymerase sigma factor, RNA polymerase sigma-70 factor, ECF subfamily [Candidatus Wolfebacteria bacterium GW2011_GWB1_47_1]KKU42526.1 MAG: RNA polymerase sigma-70 factor, ECF subfamily [Candidatus Wolfebacteria bacterium GW2011_GWB2_46_69]KKU53903.1 MAG: RNA polymerase sigma-70 factor, ECF subfamily [Candidatus Wolfebacteria bacterium GW2011_GWC1_47_103]KKU59679.1 MAG: RNA polymerase sigma-70 factor, ECF subfamily [Candidatus Wolfebacteria bacterium GW2011_GWE2_47_12]
MIEHGHCAEKTDEELVALTLQDREMYACLIRRYEAPLARYVWRISGYSDDDIADILQNAFISAYRNLNDFDPSLKFSSWLYRIAHNETISQHRKRHARPQTIAVEEGDDVFELLASEVDVVRDADRKMTARRIREVLETMDPKYRDVLVLKFLEDKDYREISDILQKPMGTIATLINRAKKQFRERVEAGGILLTN